MAFEFKNPEVAKAYESTREHDIEILVPQVYSGMLSNIPPHVAAHLVKIADANLSPKGTVTKPAAPKTDK